LITRAEIDANDGDLLLAELRDGEVSAILVPGVSNPRGNTWVTPDGISLTFRGGLLIATRGLGADLMIADVGQVEAVLPGAGNAVRVHEMLGGEDQIDRLRFGCQLSVEGRQTIEIFERRYETTKVNEVCTGDGATFTNSYWIDSHGKIWKSHQWVSELVGYLDVERL
jgi:hypothetical protein